MWAKVRPVRALRLHCVRMAAQELIMPLRGVSSIRLAQRHHHGLVLARGHGVVARCLSITPESTG